MSDKQCLKPPHGGVEGGQEIVHKTGQKRNQEKHSTSDTAYGGRIKSEYPLISCYTHTHTCTHSLTS